MCNKEAIRSGIDICNTKMRMILPSKAIYRSSGSVDKAASIGLLLTATNNTFYIKAKKKKPNKLIKISIHNKCILHIKSTERINQANKENILFHN